MDGLKDLGIREVVKVEMDESSSNHYFRKTKGRMVDAECPRSTTPSKRSLIG